MATPLRVDREAAVASVFKPDWREREHSFVALHLSAFIESGDAAPLLPSHPTEHGELVRRAGEFAHNREGTEAAIAAWLRSTPRAGGVLVGIGSSQDIARLADAIERGEHRP
jgi:hypothetical protein